MAGEAQAFQCGNCGGFVSIRAVGRSLCAICGRCGSAIDPNDPNHKILSTAKSAQKFQPIIPLGTRGKLKGTDYEVVGFIVRSDRTGVYTWEEYLLYNPMKGFSWLVQNQGSWSFVKMIKSEPTRNGTGLSFENRNYRLFLSDQAIVIYVYGEFYWQVRVGETVSTVDYICPPFMLSSERSHDESIWSQGEYLNLNEIEATFSSSKLSLPHKTGAAPHEVNPYKAKIESYVAIGIVATILCALFGSSIHPGTGNNIFTGLLLILSVPTWRIFRQSSFERERWSASDFSTNDH